MLGLLRGFVFYILFYLRGLAHLILGLIGGFSGLSGVILGIVFFIDRARLNNAWLMMVISLILLGLSFMCFIIRFKYDALILKLQPKDSNITLFR